MTQIQMKKSLIKNESDPIPLVDHNHGKIEPEMTQTLSEPTRISDMTAIDISDDDTGDIPKDLVIKSSKQTVLKDNETKKDQQSTQDIEPEMTHLHPEPSRISDETVIDVPDDGTVPKDLIIKTESQGSEPSLQARQC